jgi:hypothetical protein
MISALLRCVLSLVNIKNINVAAIWAARESVKPMSIPGFGDLLANLSLDRRLRCGQRTHNLPAIQNINLGQLLETRQF